MKANIRKFTEAGGTNVIVVDLIREATDDVDPADFSMSFPFRLQDDPDGATAQEQLQALKPVLKAEWVALKANATTTDMDNL